MKTLILEKLATLKFIVIISIITMGIVLSSNIAYGKDKNTIEITVPFPEPVITKLDGYDHIEMEGIPSLGNTGEPVLPAKGMNILIPRGKDVKSSELILGEKIILPGTYTIEPAQRPIPLSYEGKVEKTLPKDEIYKSNNPYPKDKKEKITIQKMRSYRIEVFKLCPIEYIPEEGTLSYYKSLTLKVNLSPKAKKIMAQEEKVKKAPEVKEPKLRRLSKDKERLERFIINTQDIQSYDTEPEEPTGGGIQPMGEGGGILTLVNPAESYQYVIITNDNLKNATGPYNFQTLCAEKEARGITTNIVTTEWIYANYDGTRPDGGTDSATKIRNFIIDAYNNWETEYILLGGDATGNPSGTEIIPCRELFDDPWSGSAYADTIPSDIYFCCLDGTMDYDADGIYGEKIDGINGAEIDLLAEVYVGRVPIVTTAELANFVKKTLAYENASSDYLTNTYMVGEYLGFGGPSEYATDMMEEIRLGSDAHGYTTAGFAALTTLQLNTLYDAPEYEWPKEDIITVMNDGVHIINHLGHAGVNYDMKMSNSDADALINTDYFFGYSQGCLPGAFEQDCIVEHFVKNPKGAFAFVGNSRYGWGESNSTAGPSQYYDRQFWDAVFAENIYNLGKINQDSKEDNLWCISFDCNRWCYLELNLFGDPEVFLRFISPIGLLWCDKTKYSSSSQAYIYLVDTDLNTNPNAQDTVMVYVTSLTETIPETIVLTETGPNTAFFTGLVQIRPGSVQTDGIIQVSETDEITVSYHEISPPGTKTYTAIIDGIPPLVTSMPTTSSPHIALNMDGSITITWQTDELSTSTVHYGITQSLGSNVTISDLAINHSVILTGLIADTQYYFAVESHDSAGNNVYDDNNGSCYDFIIVTPDINVNPSSFALGTHEKDIQPIRRSFIISNTGVRTSADLCVMVSSSQPWCSISPAYAEIPYGASQEIQLLISPYPLVSGVHNLNITIDSNVALKDPLVIPVTLDITAQAVLYYQEYYLIDNWSEGSRMVNGDKRLNAGEQVALHVKVKNAGSLDATNVSAALSLASGSDPYVTILNGNMTIDLIPAHTTITSSNYFVIKASTDTPDFYRPTFVLDMEDEDGHTWHTEFQIPIVPQSMSSSATDVRLDRNPVPEDNASFVPQVCADNNGYVYAVWSDERNGNPGNPDIYFNRSDDFGTTWQTVDVRLDTDGLGAGISYQVQVACDDYGHVYVVWVDFRNGSYEPPYCCDIYFNYSDDYGVTWQANDIRINTNIAGTSSTFWPQVRCDDYGNVYIVWQDDRDHNTREARCYFRYSRDYGVTWSDTDMPISGSGNVSYYEPCDIECDDNGNIYVLWFDIGVWTGSGYDYRLGFTRSSDCGISWLAEPIVLKGLYLDLACDNAGHVYYAADHVDPSYPPYNNILFNYSNDKGGTWLPTPIQINREPQNMQSYYPSICTDGDGDLYVAWSGANFSARNIYFNSSQDYGVSWKPHDIKLNTMPAGLGTNYPYPKICCDSNGRVYVAWQDERYKHSISQWETRGYTIYSNYSTNKGEEWLQNDLRINTNPNYSDTNASIPEIACDDYGDLYIVWEDTRDGPNGYGNQYRDKYSVYFRRIVTSEEMPDFQDIADQEIEEEVLLEFTVTATNSSKTPLELFWDAQDFPQDLQDNLLTATFETSFDAVTGITAGTFRWIPSTGSVGVYYPVVFVARDPSTGRCNYRAVTIGVTPVGYTGVLPGESVQDVIDSSLSGEKIYIFNDTHKENLQLQDKNLTLKGENASNATIKGNISLADSNSTIENLTIQYDNTGELIYSNSYYTDFKLMNDSGITAINSAIAIKDCIIMPDPDIFGSANFGKGIQIWNLYGNPDIAPVIENCEISNADTGIYLYSQAFGGAILGEIKNNTLDNNNYGILLRMHKEKPLIKNNEITNSVNGIHITYEDGTLLEERLNNIVTNTFSGNTDDIWCDELQSQP